MTRPFVRGGGPLVSVLIPSRGRPNWLCDAVHFLTGWAHDPAQVEFIIKADDDDTPTRDMAAGIRAGCPSKVTTLVAPRGNGYADMPLWIDMMCREAEGDWLYVYNDDTHMMTRDWDRLLSQADADEVWHGCDDVCMVVTPTFGRPMADEFFLVRRAVFEVLGHLAPTPHVDNYLGCVMRLVGSLFYSNINVAHLSDRAQDQTRADSVAAYATTVPAMNSHAMMRQRVVDAAKLLRHARGHAGPKGTVANGPPPADALGTGGVA